MKNAMVTPAHMCTDTFSFALLLAETLLFHWERIAGSEGSSTFNYVRNVWTVFFFFPCSSTILQADEQQTPVLVHLHSGQHCGRLPVLSQPSLSTVKPQLIVPLV